MADMGAIEYTGNVPVVPPDPPDGGYIVVPGQSVNAAIANTPTGATLYLRGGEYHERVVVDKGITLASYPGETAILDGRGVVLSAYQGLLDITSNGVTIDGLTVRNVPVVESRRCARGVRVFGNPIRNVTVRNCTIHDIEEIGILLHNAEDCIVENCRGYNLDMFFHPSVRPGTDWGGGFVMTGGSRHCIIRNCTVSEVWGEAIIIDKGSHNCAIEGCTVYAHWAPVYIHRSTDCAIRGNFIYGIRLEDGVLSRGIALGNEHATYGKGYGVTSRATIENNIVVGCNIGIDGDSWSSSEPFAETNIRHNTIVNCTSGITVGPIAGGNSGFVENNVIYGCATQVAYGGGFTFRYNAWAGGAPGGIYSGYGDVTSGVTLVNPAHAYARGTADPANYGPAEGSSVIDAAVDSVVQVDYFGNDR